MTGLWEGGNGSGKMNGMTNNMPVLWVFGSQLTHTKDMIRVGNNIFGPPATVAGRVKKIKINQPLRFFTSQNIFGGIIIIIILFFMIKKKKG